VFWGTSKNLAPLVFRGSQLYFWLKEGVLSMSYMLFSQPLPSDFLPIGFLEVPFDSCHLRASIRILREPLKTSLRSFLAFPILFLPEGRGVINEL
jgi:hypothetical protein